MKIVKCVLVGDSLVGKTCLIYTFCRGAFPVDCVQTVFESYSLKYIPKDGIPYFFQLWDTCGREDYRKLFVVPEIREHCPGTPFILVGLKSDLRDVFEEHGDELTQKGWSPVSTNRAKEVAKRIGAVGYYECSAIKMKNVFETIGAAVQIALHTPKPKTQKSCILL